MHLIVNWQVAECMLSVAEYQLTCFGLATKYLLTTCRQGTIKLKYDRLMSAKTCKAEEAFQRKALMTLFVCGRVTARRPVLTCYVTDPRHDSSIKLLFPAHFIKICQISPTNHNWTVCSRNSSCVIHELKLTVWRAFKFKGSGQVDEPSVWVMFMSWDELKFGITQRSCWRQCKAISGESQS